MNITYRQLEQMLSELSEERKDDTVTIYDMEQDEYFPMSSALEDFSGDILDVGHFVIAINEPD